MIITVANSSLQKLKRASCSSLLLGVVFQQSIRETVTKMKINSNLEIVIGFNLHMRTQEFVQDLTLGYKKRLNVLERITK